LTTPRAAGLGVVRPPPRVKTLYFYFYFYFFIF